MVVSRVIILPPFSAGRKHWPFGLGAFGPSSIPSRSEVRSEASHNSGRVGESNLTRLGRLLHLSYARLDAMTRADSQAGKHDIRSWYRVTDLTEYFPLLFQRQQ